MAFNKQFSFFIAFSILLFTKVSAQVLVLPNEPEQFIEDYSKQMQKQLGSYAKTPMESFSEFYKNTIQDNSKTEVLNLIQFLTKKGIKPLDLLKANNILISYQKTGKSENESIGLLAKYLRKTFEPQSTKNILEVLYQLNSFFETNQIYTSAFNRVKIVNGGYTFAFFEKTRLF